MRSPIRLHTTILYTLAWVLFLGRVFQEPHAAPAAPKPERLITKAVEAETRHARLNLYRGAIGKRSNDFASIDRPAASGVSTP
jgi:hypothetical protein